MSAIASIENKLVTDESSVWRLEGHGEFAYSDGASSEKYLEQVFRNATDLSSRSEELQAKIRDWPSEYHLSAKRSQLLSGFRFDRSMEVLEVGCGCGAITRFLGETFDDVLSIEGSFARARLARLRTRDLSSVSIVCAPFQEIKFARRFDVIFCVGVFEYSASFVKGDDPHQIVLEYFADILKPDGVLVIAIENQFGLKYLSGVREDHVGIKFEGVEGYRRSVGIRTFGKEELARRLQAHFPVLNFFYPFPDYKIPDFVLSSKFLASGHAGEMVSQSKSRDYFGYVDRLWSESDVSLELARNGMQEFFADSFLVFASASDTSRIGFEQAAISFSSERRNKAACLTRIMEVSEQDFQVVKKPMAGSETVDLGAVQLVSTESSWLGGGSLQSQLALTAQRDEHSLSDIFSQCRNWVEFLRNASSIRDSVLYVEGQHLDSIWQNTYFVDGDIHLIDREWIWKEPIRLNVVVIRAIYNFLATLDRPPRFTKKLSPWSVRKLISKIADVLGVELTAVDFDEFVDLEARFRSSVYRVDRVIEAKQLEKFLRRHPLFFSAERYKQLARTLSSGIAGRLMSLRRLFRR